MLGFCLTGVFSTVYNYLSFRLFEPPYNMSPFTVSLMFLLFLFGTVASSYTGALTMRFGAKRLLLFSFALTFVGVLITLPGSLFFICVGIAFITVGFFIGHSVASGLVGLSAKGNKGHASSLYLLFYYMGRALWAISADGSGIGVIGRGLPRSPVFCLGGAGCFLSAEKRLRRLTVDDMKKAGWFPIRLFV